ncbi:ABC transporter ATP-binding protein [Streptomyces sp. ADMS]|uniref:ABC transporter ATP-binding protein n=1 Tax=Streptomyces sp. ADMS TaxID=3071415 RepID=UPI00296F501D|nr:ABC transporter ATP-binding protein [Streptomyces sp. ADMS]MDW4909126.1 ABC transporter ATP-binding protein [Streptomyces sp. ADMS]
MRSQDTHPGERDVSGALRYLWWLVTCQRRRVILAAVLGVAWMLGLALTPYLLSRAVDDGLRTGNYSSLVSWALVLLVVGVLNGVVAITRHRTLTKVRLDAAFRTVSAVGEHSTRLGSTLSRKVTAGEMTTIGIGDVWVISNSLTIAGPGVGSVVAYIVVAGLLLSISPLLALIVLLGAPVVAAAVGPLLGRLRDVGSDYRERQGELTAQLVDIAEGLRLLNGIGGKDRFADRYGRESRRLRDEGFRVASLSSWVPTLGIGFPLLFLAAVTWLAARMAAQHTISIGDLVAVYGYVAFLVLPVSELIESGSDLSQAVVSARRVIALLRLERDEAATPATGEGPSGAAGLRDPASGVEVAVGCFTAVVSARPQDAQTVVERLGGFQPSEAVWGGIPLDSVGPRQLRDRILVADNEADIFAGTLREVVAGRLDPDDDSVRRALHLAAAEDVVHGLPDGLSSIVESQARNLSGGQRQRVRLARALLADPEVLLAVEPTSAVDARTEATIAARLHDGRSGRTTMVTTTSPLVLDRADVVHYLVEGRVAATGTHDNLLKQEPGYRRLVSRGLDDEPEAGPHEGIVVVPAPSEAR